MPFYKTDSTFWKKQRPHKNAAFENIITRKQTIIKDFPFLLQDSYDIPVPLCTLELRSTSV